MNLHPTHLKQNHEKKTRFDISTKKVKWKTGKTAPPTKRGRETRSQGYEGGGGVMRIVYEKSPVHREEQGKRPFSIRFLPKGASIPTKRGAYSYQKPGTHKPHQHRPPCKKKQAHKPKKEDERSKNTSARRDQATDMQTRFNTIPKRVQKISMKSDFRTALTERNRKKDLSDRGGRGGHADRV